MVVPYLSKLIPLVLAAGAPIQERTSSPPQRRAREGLSQQLCSEGGCGSRGSEHEYFNLLQRSVGAKLASAPREQEPDRSVRLVFVAGLEGSGHHLLEAVSDRLAEHFPIHLWKEIDEYHHSGIVPGIGCHSVAYNASTYAQLLQKFREMDPHYAHMMPRMLSYPHCGMSRGHFARRDFMHPHLRFFDNAAKEAGVDLHVLFLYRPLSDALVAGCVHRLFEHGDCEAYADTLTSNAGILLRQLKRVGGARVHCFRYGGEAEGMAAALDAALGPGMHSYADLSDIYEVKEHNETLTDWPQLSDGASQGLHRADEALQQACNGLP